MAWCVNPRNLARAAGQIFILWGGEKISCRDFFGHYWHRADRKGYSPGLPLKAAPLPMRG